MNLTLVMFLFLWFVSALPLPTVESSRTSLQPASHLPSQEVVGESIRHGKKRKKTKNGVGRGKKRRKLKNSSTRRFVEKQYLVHNRTLALLGDDVEKILLSGGRAASEPTYRLEGALGERSQPPATGAGPKVGRERRPDEAAGFGLEQGPPARPDFGIALNRLLQALAVLPRPARTGPAATTPCDKWLDCRKNLEEIFLGRLPACPCSYPSEIFYDDKVWDNEQGRYFQWRDSSGDSERLDIYKPGAEYCIRSLLADGSTSLAVQHCCYDRERKLITRGSGAGNPNYVSPDFSQQLHEKIDLLPWKLCKGDFTRYNRIRPPDNGNNCAENPKDDIYEMQVKLTKFF